MKTKTLFLSGFLTLLIAASPGAGDAQTLDLSSGLFHGDNITLPGRDIEYVDDGVVITYSIPQVAEMLNLDNPNEIIWNVPGFVAYSIPGYPALPMRNDIFTLEGCGQISVSLLEENHIDYKSKIAPAAALQKTSESGLKPERTEISDYSGFFPTSIVSLTNTEEYRGNDVNYIRVMPVQYDKQNETIRAYTKLVYKVSVISTTDKKQAKIAGTEELSFVTPHEMNAFSGVSIPVIKSETSSIDKAPKRIGSDQMTEVAQSYLIISSNSLSEAANRFADWKRKMGFNVQVALADKWTKDEAKARISQFYRQNRQALYVLFLGGSDLIEPDYFEAKYNDPDTNESTTGSFPTDYSLVCMGGDDDMLADIYHGRIPARSLSEANTAIDKIISYEKSPTIDPTHYKKSLHLAYFEDKVNEKKESISDGISDNFFMSTSENIKRHLECYEGIDVKTYYRKTIASSPKEYTRYANAVHRHDIYELNDYSKELWEDTYNWHYPEDSNLQIQNLWNTGDFLYILYSGHSSPIQWVNPRLPYNGISGLSSVKNPPFVFSISCQAGKFDEQQNMAHRFLTANGAAMNVIASSSPSMLGYCDMMCEALLNLQFPAYEWDRKFTTRTYTSNEDKEVPDGEVIYDDLNSTGKYSMGICLEKSKNYVEQWLTNDSNYPKIDNEFPSDFSPLVCQRKGFHNFGDPSVTMRTVTPKAHVGGYVKRNNTSSTGNIVVSSLPSNSRVVFYDTATNKVEVIRTSLSSITYSTTRPDKITVSVLCDGYIPVIHEAPNPGR